MAATKKVSILLSGKETVSTAANKAAGSMDDLGNRGTSAFEGLGGAVIVANQAIELVGRTIGAAVQRVSELVDIYSIQEQAERKLAAVIRATGEAAGFSAGDMQTMASSLQQVTTFGDEAILGLQSMLLTFKSIQGDALQRTTELALDLSAAFGQDLQSSALQLGKALEDPMLGLTALRRVGVTFTDAQKEMIQAMTDAGDIASAQALILDTLEGQVGGVAQAMADSSSGELAQFKNVLGDMKEAAGGLILEGLQPMLSPMTQLVEKFTVWIGQLRDAKADANNLRDVLNEEFWEFSGDETNLSIIERRLEQTTQALGTQRALFEEAAATVAAMIAQMESLGGMRGSGALATALDDARANLLVQRDAYNELIRAEVQLTAAVGDQLELEERRAEIRAQAAAQAEREAAAISAAAEAERIRLLYAQDAYARMLASGRGPEASYPGVPTIPITRNAPSAISYQTGASAFSAAELLGITDLGGALDVLGGRVEELADQPWDLLGDKIKDFADVLEYTINRGTPGVMPGGAGAWEQFGPGYGGYGRPGEYEAPAADYTDQFTAQADAMDALLGSVVGAGMQINVLAGLLDPVNAMMQGYLSVVGQLLNNAYSPLLGFVIQLGKAIGMVLTPWIDIVSKAFEVFAKYLVWGYNWVLRPIFNGLKIIFQFLGTVMWSFAQMIVNVVNAIISLINKIPGINIGLASNPFGAAPPTIGSDMLERITLDDLRNNTSEAGYDYTGIGGDNTTVYRPPDIYFYQTFNGPIIGETGLDELGRLIADSLIAYTDIGGNVQVFIGEGA